MQNNLTSLNAMTLDQLKKITLVDFSGIELKSIPEKIFLMENLEYANFSNNLITEIPDSISKLV